MRAATASFALAILSLFQSNTTHEGCNRQSFTLIRSLYNFNLTQPIRVATVHLRWHTLGPRYFNLTQPMRVATANLHKQSNKLLCILYNACLFLTMHNSQISFTIAISYPFFIILGAKRPANCNVIFQRSQKQSRLRSQPEVYC